MTTDTNTPSRFARGSFVRHDGGKLLKCPIEASGRIDRSSRPLHYYEARAYELFDQEAYSRQTKQFVPADKAEEAWRRAYNRALDEGNEKTATFMEKVADDLGWSLDG